MGAKAKRESSAQVYERVQRIARGTRILRGRSDVAEDVTTEVVLRLLKSPPEPDDWERTARRWVENEAKKLLRAERRHTEALRREAAAMTEATQRALPVSGAGRKERLPRGFARDGEGWLREIDGLPTQALRPVTSADQRAALALAHHALMLLEVTGASGEGMAIGVNGVTAAPAQVLDELRAAFRGAFGYDAEDERWVSAARALVSAVAVAHRAPADEYNAIADVMREWLPPGLVEKFDFVTPRWFAKVHRASQLGRGGGRSKAKSVERAVLDAVNTERKRQKLRPLSAAALSLAQTRKR